MKLYKIIQKNGKPKKVYPKHIAMNLMRDMKKGECFYYDVSHQRAQDWCQMFMRKEFYKEHEDKRNQYYRKLKEFKRFKVDSKTGYIKKIKEIPIYTYEKRVYNFIRTRKTKLNTMGIPIRIQNLLYRAGFEYSEELAEIGVRTLAEYIYRNNYGYCPSFDILEKTITDLKKAFRKQKRRVV
tara:strand:- start:658 stop:1203 length:546 start_codon:yes stop_codon:yes gene_type:complete